MCIGRAIARPWTPRDNQPPPHRQLGAGSVRPNTFPLWLLFTNLDRSGKDYVGVEDYTYFLARPRRSTAASQGGAFRDQARMESYLDEENDEGVGELDRTTGSSRAGGAGHHFTPYYPHSPLHHKDASATSTATQPSGSGRARARAPRGATARPPGLRCFGRTVPGPVPAPRAHAHELHSHAQCLHWTRDNYEYTRNLKNEQKKKIKQFKHFSLITLNFRLLLKQRHAKAHACACTRDARAHRTTVAAVAVAAAC